MRPSLDYIGNQIPIDTSDLGTDVTTHGKALLTSADASSTKTLLSLGSVENTALSTWAGTANITTLGTITSGVWSGTAIANGKLANSTISGVSLGGNLYTLTLGSYLTGTSYNGSSAVTAAVDATSANTVNKIVARDASGGFSAGAVSVSSVTSSGVVKSAGLKDSSDRTLVVKNAAGTVIWGN